MTPDVCKASCTYDANQDPVCYPSQLLDLGLMIHNGTHFVCPNPILSYNPKLKICACPTVKYPNRVLSVSTKSCLDKCGSNQNAIDGKCVCYSGFTVNGDDCICESAKVISIDGTKCTDTCGSNEQAVNNKQCKCKPTFTLNKDKTGCECTAILSLSGEECIQECPAG